MTGKAAVVGLPIGLKGQKAAWEGWRGIAADAHSSCSHQAGHGCGRPSSGLWFRWVLLEDIFLLDQRD